MSRYAEDAIAAFGCTVHLITAVGIKNMPGTVQIDQRSVDSTDGVEKIARA